MLMHKMYEDWGVDEVGSNDLLGICSNYLGRMPIISVNVSKFIFLLLLFKV